jgi:hypothetical protein
MTPARWCCLGLIALGILLTVVDLVNYFVGVHAVANMAGVSAMKLIPRWILRRPGRWLLAFGAHLGPFGQSGLGCVIAGVMGLVALEAAGKTRKKAEQ